MYLFVCCVDIKTWIEPSKKASIVIKGGKTSQIKILDNHHNNQSERELLSLIIQKCYLMNSTVAYTLRVIITTNLV